MTATIEHVTEKITKALGLTEEKAPGSEGKGGGSSYPPSRSVWACSDEEVASGSKPPRPTSNRVLVLLGPKKVALQDRGYPAMNLPVEQGGRRVEHGVILKVVATNICGTDLHIYRGTIGGIKPGMALGHEVTGQIVEMGRDVERFELGDFVSVPFNVACGKCDNCREQKTNACLKCCGSLGASGMYGFPLLGGWEGGQKEYHFVPYADFQLLRLPKDRAISKLSQGIAFLSDIFPTGFNAAVQANVGVGSIVYVAGAGPVGLCAAQSCLLLGAARVFVGDLKAARLELAESIGCVPIDLSKVSAGGILAGGGDDADHIMKEIAKHLPPEQNGEHTLVDAAIDAVGFECCGVGSQASKRVSEQVLNTCFKVTKAGGCIGVPGIYPIMDPTGANSDNKQGIFHLNYGLAWNKGQELRQGQCPVQKYNVQLLKTILHDRVDLSKLLNVQIISLDEAADAYAKFDQGEPVKYIIDPHGMLSQHKAKEQQQQWHEEQEQVQEKK